MCSRTRDLGRRREARAHPAVRGEVLARQAREHVGDVEAQLTDATGRGHLVVEAVELLQRGRDPARALLGEYELQTREPLEDAAHQQVHERAVGEERDLGEHHERRREMPAVVGLPAARVAVDHDIELFAHGPERVVLLGVERVDVLGVGRHRGDQDPAAEVVLLDPAHVGDGLVDVVEEDLADAGAALRVLAAPVREPAVVRPDAGQAQLEVFRLRRPGQQRHAREERRHRVRENDLTDDTVALELGDAPLAVPVAVAVAALEVAERVLVLRPPRVEVVEVLRVEVGAVRVVAGAGVAVRRDERVRGCSSVMTSFRGRCACRPCPRRAP